MLMRSLFVLSLCAVLCASAPCSSSAQAGADAELDARLIALDAYLKDLERPSRAYFGTWISVLGTLAVGQGALAVFEEDKAARAGLIVGAGLSTAGLTLVLLAPTPGRYASSRYRALPSQTVEEKRLKLGRGETYLAGEAASVRRTRSWLTHAIAVTFGVGAGLYLGLAYDDNLMGALRTGVGTFLITELRVWTRPTRVFRHQRDYGNAPTLKPSFGFMPLLAPRATGLALGGTF